MMSKWADVVLQCVVFDLCKDEEGKRKKSMSDIRAWRTKMISMMSIMHGMVSHYSIHQTDQWCIA